MIRLQHKGRWKDGWMAEGRTTDCPPPPVVTGLVLLVHALADGLQEEARVRACGGCVGGIDAGDGRRYST